MLSGGNGANYNGGVDGIINSTNSGLEGYTTSTSPAAGGGSS